MIIANFFPASLLLVFSFSSSFVDLRLRPNSFTSNQGSFSTLNCNLKGTMKHTPRRLFLCLDHTFTHAFRSPDERICITLHTHTHIRDSLCTKGMQNIRTKSRRPRLFSVYTFPFPVLLPPPPCILSVLGGFSCLLLSYLVADLYTPHGSQLKLTGNIDAILYR